MVEVGSHVLVESRWAVMVYRFQPALMVAARAVFGTLMAGAIGMASIAVAWGLFVFSGSQSAQVWFIMQLCFAGTGAGLGSSMAWFNLDRNTRLLVMLTIAVAVLGGLAGAFTGYEYGAYRSARCCDQAGASILLSPVTYSVMGSMLMANLAMLVFRLARIKFDGGR